MQGNSTVVKMREETKRTKFGIISRLFFRKREKRHKHRKFGAQRPRTCRNKAVLSVVEGE